MARNKRNISVAEDNEKSLGSKLLTLVIAMLIIFIWLGIITVFIKLDVGGFGSTILRPLIKDIPVISKILPNVSDEQLAEESNYEYQTLKEALERIKELEAMNAELLNNSEISSLQAEELEAEVIRLRELEENQLEFEQRVLEFDKNVVFADAAPNIEEYKTYYEGINPTTAEEIYRQVIEQMKYSDAMKEKADIYRKMKPKEAAAILEKMTADIDLVAQMLLTMNSSESSSILGQMDSTQAAKITKKMFDLDESKLSSLSE